MPYTPKNWVTDELIIEADLDHIEQGVAAALPKDLLDAKGDLIVASAADTAARLPAGSAGQVLSVDAAEATGLKWIPAPAGGGAGGGADYEGAWAAGTAYAQGDVVLYQGTHYIAVNPSTGQTPPSVAVPTVNAAGNELAYAETTAGVGVTATSEATANTVVTAPTITVDGATAILVECFVPFARPDSGAVNRAIGFWLYQDGVSIGEMAQVLTPAAGLLDVPVRAARRLTPSAGTHTYSLRAHTSAGSATLFAGAGVAGAAMPAFIRISTVQPAQVAVRTFTAPGIGTTLPVAPVDGDEYILVDSLTAPSYQWHFRYMASVADAYKWVFVGGAPAFSEVVNNDGITSGTYAAAATPGPSIQLPRAGRYYVAIGLRNTSMTNAAQAFMSYDIGSTGASDSDAIAFTVNPVSNQPGGMSRERLKVTSSDILVAKYKTSGATTYVSDRWMRVTPQRVA